jgi:hypothetical protein
MWVLGRCIFRGCEVSPLDLARVFRAAAAECEAIAAEQRADRRDWIEQAGSPLGNRRHVAAVKRRIAAGRIDGASMVGRRAMLSADALAEELALLSAKPRNAKPAPSGPDALRAKLGLVG